MFLCQCAQLPSFACLIMSSPFCASIALQSETAGPALPTCRHSTIDCQGELCPWEFQTRDESERLSPSRGPRQDLFKQADADNSGELEFPEIQKVLERPL